MRPRRQRQVELLAPQAAAAETMTSSTSTAAYGGASSPSLAPRRRRPLAPSATVAAVTAFAGLLLLSAAPPAQGFVGPVRHPAAPMGTSSSSTASRGRSSRSSSSSSSRSRSGTCVAVGAGRNEEWETNNGEQRERDNPWATQQQQQQPGASDNDWYMTGRIHYLREMEKLGQELHDLMDATGEGGAGAGAGAGAGLGAAAGMAGISGMILNGPGAGGALPEAGPGAAGLAAAAAALSEHEKAAREAASAEEQRRQEVLVAESCAINWREEPVFAKPVGFVPGNRKVQQVRLCDARVMYGSDSGFVGLASAVDGRDLFRLQAHSALVTALDYDAATGWALSAADDGVVHVYRETPEGRVEQVHGPAGLRLHSNRVVAAEVLDHRWGLTASMDGKILIFELDSGAVVQELWASDTLLALSVCKGYVFVGLMSGVCEAFSIRNGGRSAFRYIAQRTPIRSLRTFPLAGNQIKVVAGGQDGAIRQFHVRPVHNHVNKAGASISMEGGWKVPSDRSFDDRLVLLCNTHVDQEVLAPDRDRADQGFLLKGHKAPVVAVACDETKVVSASEDGTVIVWDAQKGTAAYTIRQHVDGDLVAAVDFNERYLVVDGTRTNVFLFDYAVGRPPHKAATPASSSSGRPSRRGASSSRRGGPKPNRGGPQPRRNPQAGPDGQPQQPPPQFPQAPFPFIGGWNLGHGPTDSVGGMGGMGAAEGAAEGAASSSSSSSSGGGGGGGEEGSSGAGPGEDED